MQQNNEKQENENNAVNGVNNQLNGSNPETSSAESNKSNGQVVSHNGVTADSSDNSPVHKLSMINKEMVRLIGQHLISLGLSESAETLMKESSCVLDHPAACRFRQRVLEGDWNKAESDLTELQTLFDDQSTVMEMKFLLVEQKYLELLESGKDMEALTCLRSQLTPLAKKMERVHKLSSLLFISDAEDLRKAAGWKGTRQESRAILMVKLQAYIPPSIMLPPHRLETMVMQAVELQRLQCSFHNTKDDSLIPLESLITNHTCSKESFPGFTTQTLIDHCDEVWVAKFSPDGTKLATGSKESTVIVWDVEPESYTVRKRLILDELNFGINMNSRTNSYAVVHLAWSPDSKKLIVCLREDCENRDRDHDESDAVSELFVWNVDKNEQICKVSHSPDDSLTCAAWNKDSTKFACGGYRGQFYLCNLEGQIQLSWEGVRVQGLAFHPDDKTILASDTHRRIRGYQLEDVHDHNILQEDHGIISFSLDETGRYALINVENHGVHLWDLETRSLVRKFRGLIQRKHFIYSCFGGVNHDFIASGSEDYKVYIWHRSRELPVSKLSGHSKTVNCVTWNPKYLGMLASVSDDCTVRIWGPASQYRNKNTPNNASKDPIKAMLRNGSS